MATSIRVLYRFFRHDDAEDDTIEWNVYSSHLEDNFRIYRFFFKSPEKHIDFERIINIKGSLKEKMAEIRDALLSLQSEDVSADFKQACADLHKEDPWLDE